MVTMNSTHYIHVLNTFFIPQQAEMTNKHEKCLFRQEGATSHTVNSPMAVGGTCSVGAHLSFW